MYTVLYVLLLASVAVMAIRFCYRYFTGLEYRDKQGSSLQLFVLLSSLTLVLAGMTLGNEILAVEGRLTLRFFPIEHNSSWARVVLFCVFATGGFLVARFFASEKPDVGMQISLKAVLPLTVLAMLVVLPSHYFSRIGWCCEQPYAFFFGFPFSFLWGMSGFESSVREYAHRGLHEILTTPGLILGWRFLAHPFLLDVLFWSSVAFLYAALKAWRAYRPRPESGVSKGADRPGNLERE